MSRVGDIQSLPVSSESESIGVEAVLRRLEEASAFFVVGYIISNSDAILFKNGLLENCTRKAKEKQKNNTTKLNDSGRFRLPLTPADFDFGRFRKTLSDSGSGEL